MGETPSHDNSEDDFNATLKGLAIEFEECDLETKEAIVDIRCLGCFPREAPVLRSDRNCFESHKILVRMGR